MTTGSDGEARNAAPDISVIAGDPTDAELAAVTAVLTAMADEVADAAGQSSVTAPTAWQRTQRAIRQPVIPGRGAWRGFSG